MGQNPFGNPPEKPLWKASVLLSISSMGLPKGEFPDKVQAHGSKSSVSHLADFNGTFKSISLLCLQRDTRYCEASGTQTLISATQTSLTKYQKKKGGGEENSWKIASVFPLRHCDSSKIPYKIKICRIEREKKSWNTAGLLFKKRQY